MTLQVSGHRYFLRQTESCRGFRAPAHTVGRRRGSERFSLERKKHTKTQKLRWLEHTIGPKTGKVDDFQLFHQNPSTFSRPKKSKSMISSCFPEIHRLSQNWQNAKSMISSCFPEIHRLSRNRQTAKSMISSCFPKIHRLSQNRQTAKSMISIYFPEIHRLSAKKGLGTGDLCRPKGRSAPLACCLPHAGG